VPSPLFTSDIQRGMFTAISVPTPDEPGSHMVTARDQSGYSASAGFTVIDMIGPEGPPGEQGLPGEPGPDADISIVAIILALVAVGLVLFGRVKKWVIG